MSKYLSILFSLLLCFISADDADDNVFDRCNGKKASSVIECDAVLKVEERNDGYHCCYFTAKNSLNDENVFECRNVVLLIEEQHGLLVFDAVNRAEGDGAIAVGN